MQTKTISQMNEAELLNELEFLSENLWKDFLGKNFFKRAKQTFKEVENNKEILRHTTNEELELYLKSM